MRKITFLILAIFAIAYTAHGQATSFESGEGFTLGAINGQNGWAILGADTSQIVDSQASDGTFSLQLIPNNGQALSGAFSPTFTSSQDVIITVDMYLESLVTGELSDTDFVTQSPSQGFLTSRINFSFDGSINVLDDPGTGLAFQDSGATVIRDAWFELKMEFKFSSGEILYYIDDALIYTGIVFAGTNVEQIIPLFDNFESSAFFDNITYQDGLVLSREDNVLNQLEVSVYPNPTEGDLSINFTKNVGQAHINIVDITGQSVLQTSFNGFGEKNVTTSNLSNGVYFAKISSDIGNTTIKFIKD